MHSQRVQEKRYVVILTQEFLHEGPCLGVCVARVRCWYFVAHSILFPNCRNRADNGPGHLDFGGSNHHPQEEAFLEIEPRKKEVKKIHYGSDQFGEAETRAAQY